MKSMIFNVEHFGKELCQAYAIEQGYTHFVCQSFEDANKAYEFARKMREHWNTGCDGLTKVHRKVYGFTVAEQYFDAITYPKAYMVYLLIYAGKDFAQLLANQPVGQVRPLESSMVKRWPGPFEEHEDEQLSLMPTKCNVKRSLGGRHGRI